MATSRQIPFVHGLAEPRAAKSMQKTVRYNRYAAPLAKTGSANEEKDSAHVLSHEVMQAILKSKTGRPLQQLALDCIVFALNQNIKNLRIKSKDSNRPKKDKPRNDHTLDVEIISRLNLGDFAFLRAQRQFEILRYSEGLIPQAVFQACCEFYSKRYHAKSKKQVGRLNANRYAADPVLVGALKAYRNRRKQHLLKLQDEQDVQEQDILNMYLREFCQRMDVGEDESFDAFDSIMHD